MERNEKKTKNGKKWSIGQMMGKKEEKDTRWEERERDMMGREGEKDERLEGKDT